MSAHRGERRAVGVSPGLHEWGEGQEAEGGDEVLGLVPGHHSQGGSHQVLQGGQPLSRHLGAHIRAVNEPSRGFTVLSSLRHYAKQTFKHSK